MGYTTIFDIIGPIMVGPSSSHTAGAVRIGRIARNIFGRQPNRAEISLYGSFARTYRGHGTDIALVGGILNYNTDDEHIVDSLAQAKTEGIEVEFKIITEELYHPNTARVRLSNGEDTLELLGISLGGGKVSIREIDGFKISLTGESPTMLVFHYDRYGAIAQVAQILALSKINIGHMEVARRSKGDRALMVIETDQDISPDTLHGVNSIEHVYKVALLNP